jgi:transcriptional regulator with XRE-family HTH domain
MPHWKRLPEDLDPSVRQFVAQMRGLKDHSGLSLARLAKHTGYSMSSWGRYLNGQTLPPTGAVERLADAAGLDPTRLLALREVAEGAWDVEWAPSALPPECACLAAKLCGLRRRAGWSLAALAGKTAYSKSSWDRYLAGKALPPRGSVEALCAAVGQTPERYLALWELADRAWSGRGVSARRLGG